jgi:hypothetical protein
MATTGADLQTMLAYRLGETSAPSDSNTKNQRYDWLSKGYFKVARKRNWWWQEATNTSNTNTGSTTGYTEPSDLKEFIELKIGTRYYDGIRYEDNRLYQNALGVVALPQIIHAYKYYRFGGKYFLLPTDNADGSTHTIKYYKRVTKLTSDADTILLPDEYAEMLAAYAEARYWMSITQQGKASAPFQEFDEIFQELSSEQSRRGWGTSINSIKDPEDLLD